MTWGFKQNFMFGNISPNLEIVGKILNFDFKSR